jgi:hypothetical protein
MQIQRLMIIGAGWALAGLAQAANDYPGGSVSFGLLGDSEQGRSYSVAATLAASQQWSINASGGHTTISNSGVELSGNSVAAGVEWRPGNWSIEPGFSRWHDNDQFSNQTPELRIAWQHASLRWQLLAERPRYGIDYQLGTGPLAQQRHFEFSGTGLGAGVEYTGLHWGAWLHGTSYSYGSEIARLKAILAAPNLARFPRLSLLAQSFATLAQGAANDRWSAGLERSYASVSWHADATLQTDALTGAQAQSLGLGANFILGEHSSLDASIGNQHAEGVGDAAFVNLILGFHW